MKTLFIGNSLKILIECILSQSCFGENKIYICSNLIYMKGNLYLIPTFLGSDNPSEVFPELNREIVRNIKYYVVEEERTARRFLKKLVPEIVIDSLSLKLLNEHSKPKEIEDYLIPCETESMGLLSEAGVPCVADPGALVVQMAHKKGINVIPLVGPSSIIMALMASGMNGQNFAFNGYLPIPKNERQKMIKFFEKRSYAENQSQLFIEAPYRNLQLLDDIIASCESQTMLCIACDITLPTQLIKTMPVGEWKKQIPEIHKRPAIFVLKKS
jgi:16S rRNA (cytidine1402-2'-O)-methyltransferase